MAWNRWKRPRKRKKGPSQSHCRQWQGYLSGATVWKLLGPWIVFILRSTNPGIWILSTRPKDPLGQGYVLVSIHMCPILEYGLDTLESWKAGIVYSFSWKNMIVVCYWGLSRNCFATCFWEGLPQFGGGYWLLPITVVPSRNQQFWGAPFMDAG